MRRHLRYVAIWYSALCACGESPAPAAAGQGQSAAARAGAAGGRAGPGAGGRPEASAAGAGGRPGARPELSDAGAPDAGDARAARDAASDPSDPSLPTPLGGSEPSLQFAFSPMYSAYDGVHVFKVPATVHGLLVERWSADPPGAVDIEPVDRSGSALLTVQRAGTVRITAEAGAERAEVDLLVTAITPEDWAIGERRYREGSAVLTGPTRSEIADDAACTGCHGSTATELQVQITPEQLAGHSDSELIDMIVYGALRPGGKLYTAVPRFILQMLHTFDGGDDAALRGLIGYLRGLEPGPLVGIEPGMGASPRQGGNAASPRGALPCGSSWCTPSMAPGITTTLEPCCVDALIAACGIARDDACMPTPRPHPACPSVDSSAVIMIGCCIGGRCGLLEGHNECRDLDSLHAEADAQGQTSLLPMPQACN
jgi:cytochrome c553